MNEEKIQLQEPLMGPNFGSYGGTDVQWLLKDLSNFELEAPLEDREESIQNGGAHYSETLPIEFVPSQEYQDLFKESLADNSVKLAEAVGVLSEQIMNIRNNKPVLVSLARAGTPIGVLIKKYLEKFYSVQVPHYAISIVRGRGIDYNALSYINNKYDSERIIFIDGWTGKGAITKELSAAIKKYNKDNHTNFSDDIAVLADPGHCVKYYGTRDDYLIPSACLNSTVSGLVSRTVLNELIGENDYHGAKFYKEFKDDDYSNYFITEVTKKYTYELHFKCLRLLKIHTIIEPDWSGWETIENISIAYRINNINLVKPGVGETTRVLLRRVPWKILIRERNREELKHIIMLAEQRSVPVEINNDMPYATIGLIHPEYTKGATDETGKSVKNG